jgi:hypothetical protein
MELDGYVKSYAYREGKLLTINCYMCGDAKDDSYTCNLTAKGKKILSPLSPKPVSHTVTNESIREAFEAFEELLSKQTPTYDPENLGADLRNLEKRERERKADRSLTKMYLLGMIAGWISMVVCEDCYRKLTVKEWVYSSPFPGPNPKCEECGTSNDRLDYVFIVDNYGMEDYTPPKKTSLEGERRFEFTVHHRDANPVEVSIAESDLDEEHHQLLAGQMIKDWQGLPKRAQQIVEEWMKQIKIP